MNTEKIVQAHYTKENMADKIFSTLSESGVDINNLTREDIASYEEFHIGGREATRLLAEYASIQSEKSVLDIGCGIGGPARTLAAEFSCTVTGLDLTEEFVKTAQIISDKLSMSDEVNFLQGSGTELPFDDNSFSAVWTQHMTMNVERKDLLFSEISRVLKPNGKYVFHEVIKGDEVELLFPVLWASDRKGSHLIPDKQFCDLINSTGLTQVKIKNHTDLALLFFEQMQKSSQESSETKTSIRSFLNKDFPERAKNVYQNLKEGRIKTLMGVFEKSA